MLKKIGLWVLIAGFSGLLVWGAVNRTSARSEGTQGAAAAGQGHGHQTEANAAQEPVRQGEAGSQWGRNSSAVVAEDTGLEVQTSGRSQGRGGKEGRDQLAAAPLVEYPEDWEQLQGEVIRVDETALELVLSNMDTMLIEGQTWRYAQELGFSAQAGDHVSVFGYLEDGEFKVGALENASGGQTVVLRDPSGRPVWAGGARGRSEL